MAAYFLPYFSTYPDEDFDNSLFTFHGHLYTSNNDQIKAVISLSTGTKANIMRLDVFEKLGLEKEPTADILVPLQSAGNGESIKPVGIARSVCWAMKDEITDYVSDFYVVSGEHPFDVVIGNRDIINHRLLIFGSGYRYGSPRCHGNLPKLPGVQD
ncbi:hypothetical protein BO94DRAFT_615833 [Aspergillus sclerotioniger CBS 115572]|uniref:Uncharacterized protein n=1 Tax=Aspergillus sclerotioniger CBS 115572 TaxID=1450535 RepID=A0A317X5Z9_9EURO|nr:hypothetical protein BO94DRAFT_615833 [Aspergillus sclerotioniger CBS 115572]PWY93062.1 hypothetical protein BO94DRAFT_615833 [Aspergillus sclerotioniger CBS 115572]